MLQSGHLESYPHQNIIISSSHTSEVQVRFGEDMSNWSQDIGLLGLRYARTDRQPENIMPPTTRVWCVINFHFQRLTCFSLLKVNFVQKNSYNLNVYE